MSKDYYYYYYYYHHHHHHHHHHHYYYYYYYIIINNTRPSTYKWYFRHPFMESAREFVIWTSIWSYCLWARSFQVSFFRNFDVIPLNIFTDSTNVYIDVPSHVPRARRMGWPIIHHLDRGGSKVLNDDRKLRKVSRNHWLLNLNS